MKESILQMLHIASRGNFLSISPTHCHNTNSKTTIPYCAPWFEPTREFFSISKYLSSRYEMALWQSFQSAKTIAAASISTPAKTDPKGIFCTDIVERMNRNVHRSKILQIMSAIPIQQRFNLLLQSVHILIQKYYMQRDILQLDPKYGTKSKTKGKKNSTKDKHNFKIKSNSKSKQNFAYVRDLNLWKLLTLLRADSQLSKSSSHATSQLVENGSLIQFVQYLSSIPLLHLRSQWNMLRINFLMCMEDVLSRHMEQILIHGGSTLQGLNVRQGGLSNKKKKKKKGQKCKRYQKVNAINIVPKVDKIYRSREHNQQLSSLGPILMPSVIPSEKRNRNTVIVLNLLEEILDNTFQILGLKEIDSVKDKVVTDINDEGYSNKINCDVPVPPQKMWEKHQLLLKGLKLKSSQQHRNLFNATESNSITLNAKLTPSSTASTKQTLDTYYDTTKGDIDSVSLTTFPNEIGITTDQLTLERNNLEGTNQVSQNSSSAITMTWKDVVKKKSLLPFPINSDHQPYHHGHVYQGEDDQILNNYQQQSNKQNINSADESHAHIRNDTQSDIDANLLESNSFNFSTNYNKSYIIPFEDHLNKDSQHDHTHETNSMQLDSMYGNIDKDEYISSNSQNFDTPSGFVGSPFHFGGAFRYLRGVDTYPYGGHEKSLVTDFFDKVEPSHPSDGLYGMRDESWIASSTAASIASSLLSSYPADSDNESKNSEMSDISEIYKDTESLEFCNEEKSSEIDQCHQGSTRIVKQQDDCKSSNNKTKNKMITEQIISDQELDGANMAIIGTVLEEGDEEVDEDENLIFSKDTEKDSAKRNMERDAINKISPERLGNNLNEESDSIAEKKHIASKDFGEENKGSSSYSSSTIQSTSPEKPTTPPSQLSPILVSLADIGEIRKKASEVDLNEGTSNHNIELTPLIKINRGNIAAFSVLSESLPGSPRTTQTSTLTSSWSREDLRIPPTQKDIDDEKGARARRSQYKFRNADGQTSSRNVLSMKNKNTLRHIPRLSSYKSIVETPVNFRPTSRFSQGPSSTTTTHKDVIIDGHIPPSACARSESALDGQNDGSSHWNVIPSLSGNEENDNLTTTKDGTTTISSVPSCTNDDNMDVMTLLKEERDAYRDMCLTLASEVSKLKNIVASERGLSAPFSCVPVVPYTSTTSAPFSAVKENYHYANNNMNSFDPEFMPPFYQRNLLPNKDFRKKFALGAMSDAGIPHYDATISEDGTLQGSSSVAATDVSTVMPHPIINSTQNRQLSTGIVTNSGSDAASLDHHATANSTAYSSANISSTTKNCQQNHTQRFNNRLSSYSSIDPESTLDGLRSRLTQDIDRFLRNVAFQVQRAEQRRALATERLRRLVRALWPRAQVKMYGSYVNKLSLPSSDLDFVICLPAVHKNAPAVAPGALEGRNAINESPLKLLARKLKSESWIDPRSLRVIDHTVVPVIKISTKDIRAKVLQLDITFDSPEHHGLQAIEMVKRVVNESTLVRPLVLVLKQFLLERGLLTAYTGGVSSYCLFLMVTRYVQEQEPTWMDCGSQLLGFLDFYGNHFDPRSTGISVSRRQYFSRIYYSQGVPSEIHSHTLVQNQAQAFWNSEPHSTHRLQEQLPVIGSKQEEKTNKGLLRRHSFQENTILNKTRFQTTRGPNSSNHVYIQPEGTDVSAPRFEANQLSINVGRPFTFDPFFVEDPISPNNNVGRNSFRISSVMRAFSDAHRAFVASLEWDMTSEFNEGEYSLLKCLIRKDYNSVRMGYK
eukprot:CAMPEP_0184874610 /NCGR_PEP_ID=MMETSP0580-20130426/42495_1 /TAXON_ID=1118495 /ORGANISM="Dactyliosolen fragilissimus" /LENGTH=1748 /DNA_ID=CAMNT_0027377651 /DNA_START=500 /DNA_END=5746 /DNA_ORIENTATION=-